MATTTAKPKELLFSWEGKDAQNKPARGEIRAPSEASARTALRRQGVVVTKITKIKQRRGRVGEKDLVLFTRQPLHHDEGGRAAAAILRHRHQGLDQPGLDAAIESHPRRHRRGFESRGRLRPSTPCISTASSSRWWPPANRPVSSTICSSAWPPIRKRSWQSKARSNRPSSIPPPSWWWRCSSSP